MSTKHTPGRREAYAVPALFWFDHEERQPCDRPEQMAEYTHTSGRLACIIANDEQIECLRSDALFYAEGNVDGVPHLVRSAKATVSAIDKRRAAIARATGDENGR